MVVEGKSMKEEASTGRGLYIASGGIMIETEVDFRSEVSGGSGDISRLADIEHCEPRRMPATISFDSGGPVLTIKYVKADRDGG